MAGDRHGKHNTTTISFRVNSYEKATIEERHINRSMGKLCLHKWSRAVCSKSGMNTSSMCFSVLTGVQAK